MILWNRLNLLSYNHRYLAWPIIIDNEFWNDQEIRILSKCLLDRGRRQRCWERSDWARLEPEVARWWWWSCRRSQGFVGQILTNTSKPKNEFKPNKFFVIIKALNVWDLNTRLLIGDRKLSLALNHSTKLAARKWLIRFF